MPVPPRVSFATLCVRDLPAMAAFYRSLGWPESKENDQGFAAFQCHGAILGLYGVEHYSERYGPAPAPGAFRGVVLAINLESPAAVDAAYETIRATAGARVRGAPADLPFGRSFEFSDPEDNVWEVTFARGTSFDACGGLIFP